MSFIAERSRKRVNSCLSTYFIHHGGRTVKYPNITNDFRLFKADGVHLSVLGCDLMLNILSEAVYAFLTGSDVIFPHRKIAGEILSMVCALYAYKRHRHCQLPLTALTLNLHVKFR
jgi:hypothetical protein